MNVNKINRVIDDVPPLRLASLGSTIPVRETCDWLPDLSRVDHDLAITAKLTMVNLAMQLAISDEPIVVAKVWIEFLRNPGFRRFVLAMRNIKTSKPPKLQDACERMRWSDEQVYHMTYVCKTLIAESRPDIIVAPLLTAQIDCKDRLVELRNGTLRFDIDERADFVSTACQPGSVPDPERPEEVVPEPLPEPGVESSQQLDNGQQLVKVRLRNGNVHYIVVDAGVDVKTAPEVWDLINRDELHLSVNVTTDRLRRTTVVNNYLAEGWSPAEAAELMGVPRHIVASDISLLRKLGRLGDTPGMRKHGHPQS
jgi:hypothetical protein